MRKIYIIPAITFIIGGCVGCIAGYKGTIAYGKKYLASDEFSIFMKEQWNEFIDSLKAQREEAR